MILILILRTVSATVNGQMHNGRGRPISRTKAVQQLLRALVRARYWLQGMCFARATDPAVRLYFNNLAGGSSKKASAYHCTACYPKTSRRICSGGSSASRSQT